jgi:uncharacterized membrane protein
MQQNRIRVLDAGRGTAMLFVFLSHFAEYYFINSAKLKIFHILGRITMIASPTFMLISGITLGYLFALKKNNFVLIQRKFADRGLFLITVAHILIYFSWRPYIAFSHASNWVLFITDTIGICLIVTPILLTRIKANGRIVLSIFLFSFSWIMVVFGNFKNLYLNVLSEVFFGHLKLTYLFDCFPVLPWFSLYLTGTILGEKIFTYQLKEKVKNIKKLFLLTGLISIASALIIMQVYNILNSMGITIINAKIMEILQYTQKNPPGLTYLLFYGGAGMILLYCLSMIIEHKRFEWIISNLEIVGRTSLFAFIIQYFMYFSIVVWINPPYVKLWPILFIVTAFINIVIVKFWYKN